MIFAMIILQIFSYLIVSFGTIYKFKIGVLNEFVKTDLRHGLVAK